MSRIIFIFIYILFFVSQLLFGAVYIGPLSLRNYMTVVMLATCIKEGYFKLDRYFGLYIVFIVFFMVACSMTGDIAEAIEKCIAYYLVCYVGYQATKCLIMKYDAKEYLVYTLLVVGIIDAIVTIGQFLGDSFSFAIFEALKAKGTSEDMLERFANYGTLSGVVMPGLLGGVANGYFLSAMCALAFYNKETCLKIYNIALALLFLVALFMVQERTAAFVGALIVIHLFFKQQKKKINLWIILLLVAVIFFFSPIIIDLVFNDQSRYTDLNVDDNIRFKLAEEAISFMRQNPLGSIYEYGRSHEFPPHNLFLNVLVYAGFLGAPFMYFLIFKQVKDIFYVIFKKLSNDNQFALLFGYVYIAYTLNSLTHNSSLVTGETMFWIAWAVFICNRKINMINN